MAGKALVMRGIGISKDSKVFPRPLQVIFKDEIREFGKHLQENDGDTGNT